jgi:hypothetical protein
MKHKHADLIKAWADGAEIEEWQEHLQAWETDKNPTWFTGQIYRIKPEPKPDYRKYFVYHSERPCIYPCTSNQIANIALYFDGETNQLKDAKVI